MRVERNRKKRSRRKKFLVGTFLIILLAVTGTYAIAQNTNIFFGAIQNNDDDYAQAQDKDIQQETLESDKEAQREDMKGKEEESLNVLLVGVDDKESGQARTDTIMLANVKPKAGEVKLASIMRDSYVEIPDHQNNKINASFAYGGVDLLKDTVQENFGITIDYYATVNFNGFVEIVDTVAPEGIEVDVNEHMQYYDHSGDVQIDFSPGTHYLDGENALNYVRFRSDSENDFGRVERQQEILEIFKDELFSLRSAIKIPQLIGAIRPNLETDVPTSKMISLGKDLMLNPIDDIETMRIPGENMYTDERYSHAGIVLELDMMKNRERLHEFFELSSEEELGSIVSSDKYVDFDDSY